MGIGATVITAGLAGIGLAFLVRASPAGRWRFKPFSCRTCLSGWGALFATYVLTPAFAPADAHLAYTVALGLAGTGLAAFGFAALDLIDELTGVAAAGAFAATTARDPASVDLPPPPPITG